MAIAYIPQVRCGKCGRTVDSVERTQGLGGARVLKARCHGQTAIVPFASEPGQTVEVFGEAKADEKEEPEPVLVLTERPLPTTSLQGLGQFDRSLAHAVDDIKRNRAMKNVVGLPDALNEIVASLNATAKSAMDRLQKAKAGHSTAVERVHKVAEVVETATEKTNAFVDLMIGSGNGETKEAPLSDDSTGSSQQSAA